MIVYDGVSLESIAPVDVVDILVSPVQLSVTNRPRPIRAGAGFVRKHCGTRSVSITFALLTNDMHTRQKQLLEINKWALRDAEAPLQIPNFPTMYLSCVCTALPEPSTRQWWESKLRLVFTAYDNPFWTSVVEYSIPCGTQFFVSGTAEPLMQIRNTFAAAASNVNYSDGTDTMTFSQIPAGNMVIDLNRETAQVNSASIMSGYTFGSHFIKAKGGTQTITGTGTVFYRERWY